MIQGGQPAANVIVTALIAWLTDLFQIVALLSRAFALFYALRCALTLTGSIKDGNGTSAQRIGFIAIGLVCLVAVAAGAPLEG